MFTDPIRLKTIHFNELNAIEKPPSLKAIQNRQKMDGVVIKSVFNPDELATIIKQLIANEQLSYHNLKESATLPISFAEIDANSPQLNNELLKYFRSCNSFTNSFSETYGVDVIERLNDIFSTLNLGKGSYVPKGPDENSFLPFTFRVILPEKCHIDLHCGNQFIDRFTHFYKYLTDDVEVHDQLSFFVLLQKPDTGGMLKIFNITYDDAEEFDLNAQSVTDKSGTSYQMNDPNQIFCLEPEMEAGDMIIFSAGKLWHRVSEVYGKTNRITLGGFVGFNWQDEEAVFWS